MPVYQTKTTGDKNGPKQRNNKGAVLQADKGTYIKENRHF